MEISQILIKICGFNLMTKHHISIKWFYFTNYTF